MTNRFLRISADIDRSTFDCGDLALNEYFKKHARQNDEKRIATCFVFLDRQDKPLGYYAYSMAQVAKINLPIEHARGLPGYPIGAIRITRLARDLSMRGKEVGEELLRNCLKRIVKISQDPEFPSFKFVIVDAKNEAAANFYEKFGFERFKDNARSLLMALETLKSAVK